MLMLLSGIGGGWRRQGGKTTGMYPDPLRAAVRLGGPISVLAPYDRIPRSSPHRPPPSSTPRPGKRLDQLLDHNPPRSRHPKLLTGARPRKALLGHPANKLSKSGPKDTGGEGAGNPSKPGGTLELSSQTLQEW